MAPLATGESAQLDRRRGRGENQIGVETLVILGAPDYTAYPSGTGNAGAAPDHRHR